MAYPTPATSPREAAYVANDAVLLACARAAHEANRAYCLVLGDASQPSWETAPEWQRVSALEGVLGVLRGNGPAKSHAGWLDHKLATGWTWGPEKDPEKKTHPCMVAYEKLPPAQRAKDTVFVAVVRAMAAALHVADPGMFTVAPFADPPNEGGAT